ncbi:MAG: glycoside hydrolase family 15 protein, partial [Synechococcales bacterium]|nr:glycoside hydrolase family 15 protein [Synechococcales bacterium]
MVFASSNLDARLDRYYQQVQTVILSRQNPITGLLPASTAVNAHGDYTDAWVRDNVYSILAVWGLAIAYRKVDIDQGRSYELDHAVIKLMRGLLFAMMRQAAKVERFKQTQSPLDSLHAKYSTTTGDTVVPDDGWGHLQVDATSIFLLILAQMTASGLEIIYTQDEVDFIQNLVYYIGRAYRTPDYGIWERGNKINHGGVELNASSIGMAKAALEALNGLNLFGVKGSGASVIHVLPDEIARCRMTLKALLPRESLSKEVDAALLSVISYPAFAIEDPESVERTRQKIIDLLQGNYGCKRFLRDGHQTVVEDTRRLHYEPTELKAFEHIECEWPLFFTYLALDGIFRGDQVQTDFYLGKLEELAIDRDGIPLLPEVYYVPTESVEAERQQPRSQIRIPNDNLPLVWAQSLYYLAQMLQEGLLSVTDIDPLGAHTRVGYIRKATVQIALLSEDETLQNQLAAYNIPTQTLQQIEPIQVKPARELSLAYTQVGRNEKLGLTGRPLRLMRTLTTSKTFRMRDQVMIFLPAFLDEQKFYLTLDYHFLVSNIKSELAYIHRHWRQLGRPIVTLLLTHDMVEREQDALLSLAQEFQEGRCGEVPVKLGSLNQLMLTGSRDRIDYLPELDASNSYREWTLPTAYLSFDPAQTQPLNNLQEFLIERETQLDTLIEKLKSSQNLYEQIEVLSTLAKLEGLVFDTGINGSGETIMVGQLIDEIYTKASRGDVIYWGIVRRAAGLLDKVDIGLSDAVTDILVRQKQIAVGRAYSPDSLIRHPLPLQELLEKLRNFCREDIRDRVLTQEILIYLSLLVKAEPDLLKGLLTLRVGYLIVLLTSDLARELQLPQDEAYERLMQLSPYEIYTRLRQILEGYDALDRSLFSQESLHLKRQNQIIDWVVTGEQPKTDEDWLRMRQLEGARGTVPQKFYPKVWKLLHNCKGLVIGDKLERRNRLDSELLISEMTAGETNFALQVEHLLNKIQAPEYRHVNIEAMV